MSYISPLRYPGGKSKLAKFIKLVFDGNDLRNGHYVEPYAGGAGIAFHLLFQGYTSTVHINDLNKSVYAFWHAVLHETESLCRLIHDTPVTMEEWYRQKRVQELVAEFSLLDLGFSTFFLNRTNRSGILQGGVIGGKKQTGDYKLDARYNKQDLIRRIKKIAEHKEGIVLYNQDAADFIKNVLPCLPKKTLVYLDPPYYLKGNRLYEDHYKHEDHVKISNLVKKSIKQKWIVSYDNTKEICGLYKGYKQIFYQLSYSAAQHHLGSEVIILCNDLSVPSEIDPARTSSHRPQHQGTLFDTP